MEFITRLLLVSFLLCAVLDFDLVFAQSDSPPPTLGNPKLCLSASKNLYEFEALPGVGWDNLQNLDMGLVSDRNYSKCIVSGKFLIPDNVLLDPVKTSKLETFGEIYDHWEKFSSTTSQTINGGAGVDTTNFSISGSFSYETETVKKYQVEEYSETTRVQMRNLRYKVKLQAEHAVHTAFKSRLLEIASHLQHNNSEYANFLAQLIVRDFGTHYITSVDAGSVLVKLDQVTKVFISRFKEKKKTVKAAAGISFFQTFNIGPNHRSFNSSFNISGNYSHDSDETTLKEYTHSLTHSLADTHGGPPFGAEDWAGNVEDHLVPIDRSGETLDIAITPRNFPEMSTGSAAQLANVLLKAIKQYYVQNTIKGCTDMDSPNFSFHANLDDGSCNKKSYNYTFGGVYQTCSPASSCGYLRQKNPFTSGYSCGRGYRSVLVRRGFSSEHRAFYSTYWCAASFNPPLRKGCFFGGLYSHILKNPVTTFYSCPKFFSPLRFGATMHVCVSQKPDVGESSVPFGGFYSCSQGNPLANKNAKACPLGYANFLGAIEQDCEINYCVKPSALKGLPKIKRPPYMSPPKVGKITNPLKVVNHDTGEIWKKSPGNNTRWELVTKSSDKQMVAGKKAGITVGVTALVGILIVAMTTDWRRHKNESKERSQPAVPSDS